MNTLTTLYAESGFACYKVGELDFYCIQDAAGEMNNAIFADADREILKKFTQNGKSPSSISTFVIKSNKKSVLVDTGNGNNLLANLGKAGIKTNEISDILLTHTHGDHVSGLFSGTKPNFPNASIWITADELNFWKSSNNKLVEKTINAYGDLKIIVTDEKTPIVLPEIVAVDAVGHTPGHVTFLVTSKGQKVFIAGDLLHSASLQFPHPEISSRYDNDPKQAAEIRKKLLTRTVKENWIFVSAHIPFPGFIRLEANGEGFKIIPVTKNNVTETDAGQVMNTVAGSFYDFTVTDIDGKEFPLRKLKGKKVLVVNVASKCGLTPQYKDLQELYETKRGDNFEIVAFPANDFGKQEPGTNAEIKEFCNKKYDVTFPIMSKISVAGKDIHPVYKWLTDKKLNGVADAPVQWNFQKFLIDENGNWIKSIPPKTKPTTENIF
ncbi:MAG: MBL fold metallo-hydrolase [Planctomycetaceae bacterium]|jgi:glutathione peroxidase|nr:MBL fold metallo-hydrolase [Planctomycetaceae bacterium]